MAEPLSASALAAAAYSGVSFLQWPHQDELRAVHHALEVLLVQYQDTFFLSNIAQGKGGQEHQQGQEYLHGGRDTWRKVQDVATEKDT